MPDAVLINLILGQYKAVHSQVHFPDAATQQRYINWWAVGVGGASLGKQHESFVQTIDGIIHRREQAPRLLGLFELSQEGIPNSIGGGGVGVGFK